MPPRCACALQPIDLELIGKLAEFNAEKEERFRTKSPHKEAREVLSIWAILSPRSKSYSPMQVALQSPPP